MITKPEVFIVESLAFNDEGKGRFEGKILMDLLRLCGKDPRYYYVRTKRELQEILGFFKRSDYRYLHLSCHGNSESIATTLDDIAFRELGKLLRPCLNNRRLFISACEAVNDDLANALMPTSGCLSIIGPHEDVTFDEAAIVWASFYQLMFSGNFSGMRRRDIKQVLQGLVELFEVPIAYCGTNKQSDNSYRIQVFGA